MNDNPPNPDLLIAELKTKGMKQREIAKIVYPELPIESAVVKVSRHINKGEAGKYLEQTKTLALKQFDITWTRLISKLEDKLDAQKTNYKTGELEDDNPTQMQAIKQLIDLIKAREPEEADPLGFNNLPEGIDEIQLIRLMKNK